MDEAACSGRPGFGQSYSMVFYAQKILRKLPGTDVCSVTDRVELDGQIAKRSRLAAVTDANDVMHQRAHLRSSSVRIIGMYYTIHKFRPEAPPATWRGRQG